MVFSKLPSAYEDKKECYVVHIVELFLQQQFPPTPSLFTCPANVTLQVSSPSTHQQTPFKLYLL